LNVIKKIREGFFDFPYASSQAIKRALRDTLKGLGYSVSPIISSSPARTAGNPIKYIDDDLFGYMEAGSKKTGNSEVDKLNGIRKAVISMTPLLSLREFQDNVDFGANMMGLQTGNNPMPYETEVHRGWYRISLYIELDRVGTGDGFITEIKSVSGEQDNLDELLKGKEDYDFVKVNGLKYSLMKKLFSPRVTTIAYNRAKALLDAIRFLAPSGRSSNWLIDLTPKLMVAAYVKGARTPFLETPLLDEKQNDKNVINIDIRQPFSAKRIQLGSMDSMVNLDDNNSSKEDCIQSIHAVNHTIFRHPSRTAKLPKHTTSSSKHLL
jgi:CRISPR-associated protein Cst2